VHCAPDGFECEGVVVVDEELEGEVGEALGVQVADADVLLHLPKVINMLTPFLSFAILATERYIFCQCTNT
jgi:hypothetical protein